MTETTKRKSHVSSYAAMSVDEIAKQLGCSRRTVCLNLKSALKKLRRRREFIAVLQEAAEFEEMKRAGRYGAGDEGDELDG